MTRMRLACVLFSLGLSAVRGETGEAGKEFRLPTVASLSG